MGLYLSGLYWRLLLTCFPLYWASTWADPLLEAAAYLFSSVPSLYLSGPSTGGCCLPVFLCTEPLLERTLYWRLLLTCSPLSWASTWADPLLEAAAYLFSSVLSLYLSGPSNGGCCLPVLLRTELLLERTLYWRLLLTCSPPYWASTWADPLLEAAAYLFSYVLSFYLSGPSTGGCCLPVLLRTELLLERTPTRCCSLPVFPYYTDPLLEAGCLHILIYVDLLLEAGWLPLLFCIILHLETYLPTCLLCTDTR